MSDLPPLDQLDLDGMAPRTRAQRASLPVDLFGSSDGSADHSLPSEGLASLPNPSETLADLSQPSDDLANPPDPSGDLASLSQLGANPTGAPAAAADSEELSSDTDNSSSNENSGGSHIDLSDLVQGSAAIYSRGRLSRTQWASAKAGINSRDTFKIVSGQPVTVTYYAFQLGTQEPAGQASAQVIRAGPVIRIGPRGSRYERPSCTCSTTQQELCQHIFVLQDMLQTYPAGPGSLQALNHSGSAYSENRSFLRLADVGISQLARQLHFTDHSPSHSGRLGENLTQGAFLSSLDDDQKRALAAIMANTPGLPAVFADRVRARLGDGEVAAGSPAVEPRQGQGAGAGAGRGSKREREGGEASVKGGGGGRKRGRK